MQEMQACEFNLWDGKISWRRKWHPISVFLPGKSHGQRSPVGSSPWGWRRVRLNLATERTRARARAHTHTRTHNLKKKGQASSSAEQTQDKCRGTSVTGLFFSAAVAAVEVSWHPLVPHNTEHPPQPLQTQSKAPGGCPPSAVCRSKK